MRAQLSKLFDTYRRQLTKYESVLAYSLLGVVGGIASGLVVLVFELAIRETSTLWGVTQRRRGLRNPASTGLVRSTSRGWTPVGLFLHYAQTRGPRDRHRSCHQPHALSLWHPAPAQCAGAVYWRRFRLATGQSGGREGPGVHLGGAINSLLGQWLSLPNNSLRMLIACGTAGGIAAAFQHTPGRGDFRHGSHHCRVHGGRLHPRHAGRSLGLGDQPHAFPRPGLFSLPPLELNSLLELPFIMLLGLCCGIAVAAFIRISKLAARLAHWPVATALYPGRLTHRHPGNGRSRDSGHGLRHAGFSAARQNRGLGATARLPCANCWPPRSAAAWACPWA